MPYAAYFEFRKEDSGEVYQALFIPCLTFGTHIVQPTYAFKRLTSERPRRVWELHSNPGFTRSTTPYQNVTDLMQREVAQLDGLHVYITSVLADPDWKTTGSFPVEIATTDLLALKEKPNKMPATLSQRIKDQRTSKSFPTLPEAS